MTTTVVSDSFNRANSTTTLGNADTGQTWQYFDDVWGISNNQAQRQTMTGAFHHAYIDSGVSDCNISVVNVNGVTGVPRIWYRCTNDPNGNGLYVQCGGAGSNTYKMYQCVSGTITQLVSTTQNAAANDTVEIDLSGSTHTLFVNGTQIAQLTNQTFNQTATIHGLGDNGTTAAVYDNYSVTTNGGGVTPLPETASFSGQGSITATATIITTDAPSIEGTGALSATTTVVQFESASISGQGSITATSTVVLLESASLHGTGYITAASGSTIPETANIRGQGILTATATVVSVVSATVEGKGTVTETSLVVNVESVNIGGAGMMSVSPIVINVTMATLECYGTITAVQGKGVSGVNITLTINTSLVDIRTSATNVSDSRTVITSLTDTRKVV